MQVNALVGQRVDAYMGAVKDDVIGIKSIQRGYSSVVVSGNSTATITLSSSVTPAKCAVLIQPRVLGGRTLSLDITDSTTITITNGQSGNTTLRVEWQVVEFY